MPRVGQRIDGLPDPKYRAGDLLPFRERQCYRDGIKVSTPKHVKFLLSFGKTPNAQIHPRRASNILFDLQDTDERDAVEASGRMSYEAARRIMKCRCKCLLYLHEGIFIDLTCNYFSSKITLDTNRLSRHTPQQHNLSNVR